MKVLVLLITHMVLLFNISFGAADTSEVPSELLKEINNLTTEQEKLLKDSYKTGNKYGYGSVLAAICWKESRFGKNMVYAHKTKKDIYNESVGPYQQLMSVAMLKHNLSTNKEAVVLKQKYINNHSFARSNAMEDLLMWVDHWKNKRKTEVINYALASYNAGADPKYGIGYSKDVLLMAKIIENYVKSKIALDIGEVVVFKS